MSEYTRESYVQVPSSSRSGVTHLVTIRNGAPVACTCEGFFYRGRCKHAGEPTARAYSAPRPRYSGYTPAPTRWQALRDRVTSWLPVGVQAVINDAQRFVFRARVVGAWLGEKADRLIDRFLDWMGRK